MADKTIRVTADSSPIRELRGEVQGLTRDVNQLNNATSKQNTIVRDDQIPFEKINERNIQQTQVNQPQPQTKRQQIEKRILDNNTDINELIERRDSLPENDDYRLALQREIDNLTKKNEILNNTLRPQSNPTRERREELKNRISKNNDDISDLTTRRKNIDRSTDEGKEEYDNVQSEIKRLRGENTNYRDELAGTDERGPGADANSRQIQILRQIQSNTSSSKESLINILSIFSAQRRRGGEDQPTVLDEEGNPIINNPPNNPPNDDEGGGGRNERMGRYSNVGTGTTSILIDTAIRALGQIANSRNTYESGAALIGSIGGATGGIIGSVGNALGPVGGMIGGIVGGAISGISSVVSAYAQRAVQKLEELERNSLLYTQTTGQSLGETKEQALNEGAYAARALGIDAGQYIQRRGDLLRNAGGRILGATETDQNGTGEANSLMAVERLMGINSSSINQLSATMRFAQNRGTEFSGNESSSNSPSAIINSFERTMKELKIPFSEIASTMEESLSTFNKTASNILDKAGDFDANKVAMSLNSIRLATGMEGRQLERVQTAFTGQEVSQDPVTQALLMRTVKQAFPELKNLSDVYEKIETMAGNTTLQREFLNALKDLTATDEQLKQILHAVFPGMRWNEINRIVDAGLDPDEMINEINPAAVQGNQKETQYKADAAARTVGLVEASTAEKSNKDAANGAAMLKSLNEIDEAVRSVISNTNVANIWAETMATYLKTTVEIINGENETVNKIKGIPQRIGKYAMDNPGDLGMAVTAPGMTVVLAKNVARELYNYIKSH